MEWDWQGIAALIAALGGGRGLWKAARAYAKNELLIEQSQKTIAEKDKEIERLWRLLDSQTRPEE